MCAWPCSPIGIERGPVPWVDPICHLSRLVARGPRTSVSLAVCLGVASCLPSCRHALLSVSLGFLHMHGGLCRILVGPSMAVGSFQLWDSVAGVLWDSVCYIARRLSVSFPTSFCSCDPCLSGVPRDGLFVSRPGLSGVYPVSALHAYFSQ
jgi:hypothetical protein